MVKIRLAVEADIPALQEIERGAYAVTAAHGHPELNDGAVMPEQASRAAIGRSQIWVADEGTGPIGWIYLAPLGGEPCIGEVVVAPSSARRGIGAALVQYVIAYLRQQGSRSIILNTQDDLPWNRPWYERHGFVVVAPQDWTDAMRTVTEQQSSGGLDWTTRVHMRLNLDDGR